MDNIEHPQLVCGEAFAIVNGFLLELERVCEKSLSDSYSDSIAWEPDD